MKLEQLLSVLENSAEPLASQSSTLTSAVSGIFYNSRSVQSGGIFVAVRGFHADGHAYIADAASRGAIAVIGTDRARLQAFVSSPDYQGQAVMLVPDERIAMADLAAAFYDYPARQLGVIGVTGTDGKTTTTFLISALLEAAGHSTGLIGTVDLKVGPRRWANDTRQTTLESPEIQSLLREMVQAGCDYAVLESSSHGLALHKVRNCAYDVAVLTNVTQEHLDFHGTVEQYRRDKARLFAHLADEPPKPWLKFPKTAIVNADDPNANLFIQTAQTAARQQGREVVITTYGVQNPADVTARDIIADARSTAFTVDTPHGSTEIKLRLPGSFNVHNSLAAICAGLSQGLSLSQIKTGLEQVAGVPGRMETIEQGQPFSVIVDYAHTPESLGKVLGILRPLTPGQLFVVFGSAGERDRVKRPLQGEVAARIADFAVFANEDPRLEDETAILDDIAAGAIRAGWQEGSQFLKIADRRAAIAEVMKRAGPGDTVLLAGKGHEQSIIMADHKMPWDERDEARVALQNLGYNTPLTSQPT